MINAPDNLNHAGLPEDEKEKHKFYDLYFVNTLTIHDDISQPKFETSE